MVSGTNRPTPNFQQQQEKISIFSTVHEMSQTFQLFTDKTPNTRWGGG